MSKDLRLSAADAKVDRGMAIMRDWAREDIDRWGRLVTKLRDPKPGDVSMEEMSKILILAELAATIVTGRLIGRKI